MKAGPNKGQLVPIVTRDHGIDLDRIQKVYLSPKQDDYMVIFINDTYAACLEVPLKTEFVTTLSKKYKERVGKELKIMFDDKIEFVTKKGKIGSDKVGSNLAQMFALVFSVSNNVPVSAVERRSRRPPTVPREPRCRHRRSQQTSMRRGAAQRNPEAGVRQSLDCQ